MTDRESRKNILVLGGSGFIGTAVVSGLVQNDYTVYATYCNHRPFPDDGTTTWLHWDATSRLLPDIDWNDIHAVLHLANYPDLRRFPEEARSMYRVIVESTFNLMEKAYDSGVCRVIVASTGDVLANVEKINQENTDYTPRHFYGSMKACAELITCAYEKIMSAAVLRFYYPYGRGGERFLVGRLFQMVREGKEITIEGDSGITINPVHIKDLVSGTILALESDATGLFHLAGPECTTLRDLLELAGRVTGCKPRIRSVQEEVLGGHAGSYERAASLLGYSPTIMLEEGLKDLLQ